MPLFAIFNNVIVFALFSKSLRCIASKDFFMISPSFRFSLRKYIFCSPFCNWLWCRVEIWWTCVFDGILHNRMTVSYEKTSFLHFHTWKSDFILSEINCWCFTFFGHDCRTFLCIVAFTNWRQLHDRSSTGNNT